MNGLVGDGYRGSFKDYLLQSKQIFSATFSFLINFSMFDLCEPICCQIIYFSAKNNASNKGHFSIKMLG
jgi:hypothetical protein